MNIHAPPVPMAAPQRGPWTLVAPGSQVLVATGWRTVTAITRCAIPAYHGSMCDRFEFDGDDESTHADIRSDVWICHPVTTGGRV
jgi:hypothetical protein